MEGRTKRYLPEEVKRIVLNSSNRIHYHLGLRMYLEYDLPNHEGKWNLAEKEGVRWYDCYELNEKAKEILIKMLEPVVDLFKLKETDYSLEIDNIRSVLDRYADKLPKISKVEDKDYGSGKAVFYKKENLIIEVREFDEIDLGMIENKEVKFINNFS